MLGTEKASYMFFSVESICEDNGERKSYKKTEHFRVEIAKTNTRAQSVKSLLLRELSSTECRAVVKTIFYFTKQELS